MSHDRIGQRIAREDAYEARRKRRLEQADDKAKQMPGDVTWRTKDGTPIARDAVPDFMNLLARFQFASNIDATNRARQARAGYPGWGKLGGAIQRATDLYYDDGIIPLALHDEEAPWDRT